MLTPSEIEPLDFLSALDVVGLPWVQANYRAGRYRSTCYNLLVRQWLALKTGQSPRSARQLVLLALGDVL